MTDTQNTLLALLRMSLNGHPEPLSSNVDWPSVIDMAGKNGVLSLCYDALELLPRDCRPDMDSLMDWVGQTSSLENQFEHNWEVAQRLGELWGRSGIEATVLKGRSIAQYYPRPNHRYSCDLDVFIGPDWDKACNVLESEGIELVHEVYKEVEFTFDGVYVECHRYITPVRGNKHLMKVERYLRSLLEKDSSVFVDSNLISPSLQFTTLLYIEHALGDLLHDGLSLKHVVDWAVLRKQDNDWDTFNEKCKEFRFDRFVKLINDLADAIEGKKDYSSLPPYHKDVFDILFVQDAKNKGSQTWLQRRVSLFFGIIKSRKYYSRFGYCSMARFLITAMWAHFFCREVTV